MFGRKKRDRVKIFRIFSRYPIYVFVGLGVTVTIISFRGLLGLLIEDDTNVEYVFTMVIAYLFGIGLSYISHTRITFQANELSLCQKLSFATVHLTGLGFTTISSLFLKYQLVLYMSPTIAKFLAFGISAGIISLLSFLAKKFWVFKV